MGIEKASKTGLGPGSERLAMALKAKPRGAAYMETLGVKICSPKADGCEIQVTFHVTLDVSCFSKPLIKSGPFHQ